MRISKKYPLTKLKLDPQQLDLLHRFEEIAKKLGNKPLFRFFGNKKLIAGIYLYGGVGTGKTMFACLFDRTF